MSVSPDHSEPLRADPRTLLGRLQRGTGRGALEAASACAATVCDLVLECVRHDPREDRQVESRADYYAKLLIGAGADGTAIEAILAEGTPPDLAISVLGELFLRGDTTSERLLRTELESGPEWGSAVSALLDERVDGPLPGVDEILCARWPDDEALTEAIGYLAGEREPWLSWRASNPRIATLIQRAERKRPVRRQELPDPYSGWSVERMLEEADQQRVGGMSLAIRKRVVPADRERLLVALDRKHPWRCRLALFGLVGLADPETFPALRGLAEEKPDLRPVMLRHPLYRAIVAIPGRATLETARCWFHRPEPWLRRLGCGVLERHATAEDLARLTDAVPVALADGDSYRQCSITKALGRIGDPVAVPAVERVYHEAVYSWARADALEALTSVAPALAAERFAYESLWDCEYRTRSLACRVSRLDHPETRRRLDEMAGDRLEDDDLRKQAAGRLEGSA